MCSLSFHAMDVIRVKHSHHSQQSKKSSPSTTATAIEIDNSSYSNSYSSRSRSNQTGNNHNHNHTRRNISSPASKTFQNTRTPARGSEDFDSQEVAAWGYTLSKQAATELAIIYRDSRVHLTKTARLEEFVVLRYLISVLFAFTAYFTLL